MYPADSRGISIRKRIIAHDVKTFKKSSCLSVQGESEGYTVKSKEKDIVISDYPLLQTEFLYESKKGRAELFEFKIIERFIRNEK